VALLFCDGFDHYGTDQIEHHYDNFNDSIADWNTSSSVKRTGIQSLQVGNADHEYMDKMLSDWYTTLVFGFAMYWTEGGGINNHDGFHLRNGTGAQVTVKVNNDGSISVYRGTDGGTLLGSSSAGVVTSGEWQYLEAKIYCHSSAGTYEVRIDESSVVSGESANTQNQSDNNLSLFRIKGADSQYYVDDLYICSDEGSYNNDFLGDQQVDTLYPTGAGTYSQMFPSGEVNNWQCVADTNWGPSHDHVASSGELIDTYIFSGLTELVSDNINAVQVSQMVYRPYGGVARMSGVSRFDSVDYSGEVHFVRDQFEQERTIFERTPSGEAQWTYSDVNGGEFGIKQMRG
jgi:hypothetical protein